MGLDGAAEEFEFPIHGGHHHVHAPSALLPLSLRSAPLRLPDPGWPTPSARRCSRGEGGRTSGDTGHRRPGDIHVHQTAGYANIHRSQVFVSGFDPDFARTTMGDRNVLAPIEARLLAEPPVVNRAKREVRVTLKGGPTPVARQVASQGCVTLPLETGALAFTPKIVHPNLRPADAMDSPMGHRDAVDAAPAGVDSAQISKAVEVAFAPAGLTQAFVVRPQGTHPCRALRPRRDRRRAAGRLVDGRERDRDACRPPDGGGRL